jgi:hypothetical protein
MAIITILEFHIAIMIFIFLSFIKIIIESISIIIINMVIIIEKMVFRDNFDLSYFIVKINIIAFKYIKF